MKLPILTACVVLAAGPALAEGAVTARLATPVAEKTKLIAGGAVFTCEGDTCVALAPTLQTFAASTCKVVAGRLGQVVTFRGHKVLDERRLADCNRAALARTRQARADP